MSASGAVDELVLLERVFLRIGSAETDQQLENALLKFLAPVLLKLSSQQEGVRKKVMELLVHINKRIKSRPLVQLPVIALLVQYQDPAASSFVINFTIIYIKLGFPRLPVEKQIQLVPMILSSLDGKPQQHQDSLLLLITPFLGKVQVPADPAERRLLFRLREKPNVAKHLLALLLDMLLLPYGALTPKASDNETPTTDSTLPIPPGMSEYTFKRVTNENPLKPEELEQIKLGIVKFLSNGIYGDDEILLHLIVAAADTRFSVANAADFELKKFVGCLDWSSTTLTMPLYLCFLGSQSHQVKPNMKKLPVSTRIRLKLITYMCRITGSGFVFPASIQIIFDSVYGANTSPKLKTLALNFATSLVRTGNDVDLHRLATVLITGLLKLVREEESPLQGQAFIVLGLLGNRFPMLAFHKVNLLETFFKSLENTQSLELRLQVREGFLSLIPAYKYDIKPDEYDKDGRINMLFVLVKYYLFLDEPMVRFAAVRAIGTIFPSHHVPSKFLLLLATGDSKDDVRAEAFKSLYGTSRKADINLSSNGKTPDTVKVVLPTFDEITKYIFVEAVSRIKSGSNKVNVGSHVLPFTTNIFLEILYYLRLCLLQNLEVPLTRDVACHPCEYTVTIRNHIYKLYDENSDTKNTALFQYATLVHQLLIAHPETEPLCMMLEVIGCVPDLSCTLFSNTNFLRDLLKSTREDIREYASLLYGIVTNKMLNDEDFKNSVNHLITQITTKNLEAQHGAILGVSNALECKILTKKATFEDVSGWQLFKDGVLAIIPYVNHQTVLLASGASVAVGKLGRCTSLPLENDEIPRNGSPNAKRPANEKITKFDLVKKLLENMTNTKLSSKVRERTAKALGLICVGEEFPYTKEVIQGFLCTAKETKDVEVHFTVGESLVMCIQSIWSPEARDLWRVDADDYRPSNSMLDGPSDDNLDWLLNELLKFLVDTHPNSRQATCIWLLALLKHCGSRAPFQSRLKIIQNAFMEFLGENNDIVQDVASKGLCLIYDNSKSEELLNMLVDQLTTGRRKVMQVASDTKLFEEGELGKSPTGGSLSTYKELCSLASDLNKPDLIYQFMHLANHNAIWNSKKGAAFGFSTIAEKCGEHLQVHLPKIIPKLYRYQFDPTPNLQASMQNIWHVLVPETQKMLDLYHHEILKELLENLTSSQYRVRQSCCLALQDFLKGAGNRSIHDSINYMNELWTKIFRVMDDHHEATRVTAVKTGKVLSKLCIRGCDISQGKAGVQMVQSILPVILNVGITNAVAEVRLISLQTVSELVGAAGNQLKPFLPQLIPALLQATGELESSKLSYLSTMLGAQSQAQEVLDGARASAAKSHFTTETVSKCLQYIDVSILEELTQRIIELMKSSVGLGTRIVCAHFITLLVIQVGQGLQPFTGKYLAALVNGLTDRNASVRKHYALAIGHLVGTAKDSSLAKLFAKINHWFFEREDDTIRSACAYTIQSIGNHNQEILKSYSDVIMPLVFFAMHEEKNSDNEKTIEIWTEIWSENSPGTEAGIRLHIEPICGILKTTLESPSWNMKSQAANAVSTVASKLGASLDSNYRNMLIEILLNGLSGRTWTGKDKLLKALASICSSCKDLTDSSTYTTIIDAVLKECQKEETVYKISALTSLGEILASLKVDKFEEVYNIAQAVLSEGSSTNSKDDEISSEEITKHRENKIKLKEVVYETLGKAWPDSSNVTQEKYREIFVEHCTECLQSNTRTVQVSMITALRNYIDKLMILKQETHLLPQEQESLTKIVVNIIKVASYTLGISKYTRLKKDTLSVIYSLTAKLKENNHHNEVNMISKMFNELLPELLKDNQPEIKSRVTDIKNLLSKD